METKTLTPLDMYEMSDLKYHFSHIKRLLKNTSELEAINFIKVEFMFTTHQATQFFNFLTK